MVSHKAFYRSPDNFSYTHTVTRGSGFYFLTEIIGNRSDNIHRICFIIVMSYVALKKFIKSFGQKLLDIRMCSVISQKHGKRSQKAVG